MKDGSVTNEILALAQTPTPKLTPIKLLSQSAILATYGVEKSFLRQLLNNQFYIPELFRDCLSHYRICSVSSNEFRTRLREGVLVQTVSDKPVEFSVIYHHCSPSQIRKAERVQCSFRAAKPEIGLEAVVMVRVVREF